MRIFQQSLYPSKISINFFVYMCKYLIVFICFFFLTKSVFVVKIFRFSHENSQVFRRLYYNFSLILYFSLRKDYYYFCILYALSGIYRKNIFE